MRVFTGDWSLLQAYDAIDHVCRPTSTGPFELTDRYDADALTQRVADRLAASDRSEG